MSSKSNISPCGLDCSACDIFLARENREIAGNITQWIKENYDPDCTADMIHCAGCPGDRNDHWTPDCWILKCCVDEHELRYCFSCVEFPCEKLSDWAKQCAKYEAALSRLIDMKKELN